MCEALLQQLLVVMGDEVPDSRRKMAALKKLSAQRHMEELKAAVAQRSQAAVSSDASPVMGCLLQALAFLKGERCCRRRFFK